MRRLLIFITLITLSIVVFAAVPPMINYQGKLLTPAGTSVADGTYQMQFAIYPVPTGGTAIWSEVNPTVQLKKGLFSVLLGSVNHLPDNIFDSPDRFFGVTVGADPEMTPRQQITTAAYAFKAAVADRAGEADLALTANTVSDGAITGAKIVDGAISSQKLADNAITAAKIAPNALALTCVKKTNDFSTTSNTYVQVPGFSATATLPTNGRMVKITVWCRTIQNITGGYALLSIWDGPVGTGTKLADTCAMATAHQEFPVMVMAIIEAPAGTHTYNVGLRAIVGEAYLSNGTDSPGFILVEAL